jgi:hypothetical protein
VLAEIFRTMSETWTSLLSGVVGAIVGGAASLAGTMLVNKQQMTTNARMRLYDELLPKITDRIDSILDDTEDPATKFVAGEQIPGLLDAVRRACAIVGPFERKASHNLIVLWLEYLNTPSPKYLSMYRSQ